METVRCVKVCLFVLYNIKIIFLEYKYQILPNLSSIVVEESVTSLHNLILFVYFIFDWFN